MSDDSTQTTQEFSGATAEQAIVLPEHGPVIRVLRWFVCGLILELESNNDFAANKHRGAVSETLPDIIV